MPDLVGDLLCILEHAGVQKAIAVGYATTPFLYFFRRFIRHYRFLQGTTGALSLHMKPRASGPTFSQPS